MHLSLFCKVFLTKNKGVFNRLNLWYKVSRIRSVEKMANLICIYLHYMAGQNLLNDPRINTWKLCTVWRAKIAPSSDSNSVWYWIVCESGAFPFRHAGRHIDFMLCSEYVSPHSLHYLPLYGGNVRIAELNIDDLISWRSSSSAAFMHPVLANFVCIPASAL